MDNIQTERTILRRLQMSDLNNMTLLETDPDIMKFAPSRVPLTIERIEERLKSFIEKAPVHSPLGIWAVELKNSKDFVGWFMLVKTEFEVPELGFMIVKDHWGKGIATEVAQALIEFGMRKLKYPGIMAVTDYDNAASIRVLEKLGFKKVSSRIKLDKVLSREVEAYIFELRKSLSPVNTFPN